jgi:hypothetical protein
MTKKRKKKMPPKPCGDCGINFMKVAEEKLCHTCIRKEKERENKYKKEYVNMDLIRINIEMDKKTQAEIEEICINDGINFSDYFLELHKLNTQKGWTVPSIPTLDETISEANVQSKKSKGKK